MPVKRVLEPKECPQCQSIFHPRESKSKFCSKSCYSKSMEGLRPNNYAKTDVPCSVCGAIVPCSPSRIKRSGVVVCSGDCRVAYTRKLLSERAKKTPLELIKCSICGKEHNPSTNQKTMMFEYKTCSRECTWAYKHAIGMSESAYVTVSCDHCSKQFKKIKNSIVKNDQRLYCSKDCFTEGCKKYYKGRPSTQATVNCSACGNEMLLPKNRRERKTKKGKPVRFACSKECRYKLFAIFHSGENSHLWNHSATDSYRDTERQTEGYRYWRLGVYKRDNYDCQCCGKHGGEIAAHHIFGYLEYPHLRMCIDNGVTLCKACHFEFHSIYEKKNNSKEQLIEFYETFKLATSR